MKEALVIILLLISVGLNVVQFRNAREAQQNALSQNRANQEAIQRAGDSIKTAVSRINELEAKGIRTRDSAKVAQNAAKREIQAYRQTIERLRPLVASKIDSFPDLREFVAAQDSTIEHQDSLLRDTEIFCQLQVNDLQAIIQLQNEKYVAQEAISQAWMDTASEAQKQARKEKRGKRLWQWTAGGITAIALFLAVHP